MLKKKKSQNVFSSFLTGGDIDDPDELRKAWEDDNVDRWEDVIHKYGNPARIIKRSNDNDEASDDEKEEQQISITKLNNSYKEIKPPSEIFEEKSKRLLRQREFDPHQYIDEIFKHKKIEEIHGATLYFQGGGESEAEIQTKIADNLHNYVKAYDDILKTAEQFQKNCFPGKQDVDELYEEVTSILDKMNKFFKDIRVQSVKAQNASALYSRISTYSFIFTLPSEIDNYRTNSQFEEIARVMQKANNFPYLKDLPLFSEALSNIKKSLRNVEDSLQTKLQQMNYKTFNRNDCKLLLDITSQHEANPIIKMLHSINEKIRKKLNDQNFNDACSAMEESLPFWKVLCDFFEEYYNPTNENRTAAQINQYQESQTQINELLLNLLNDFNKQARDMLDQIKSKPLPQNVFFNSELHNSVSRVYAIWSRNIMPFSKATALVNDLMNDLQNWYISFLKDQCNSILNGPEPGNRLSRFLVQMLGDSNIFSKETYKSIILDPIYDYYDNIHENALVNDSVDLVSAVTTLDQLSRKNMDKIFEHFQTNGEASYTQFISERDYDTVHTVGDELSNMLKRKLLRKVTKEFNSAIYNGMFMKNIDWNSPNLQVRPDGWIVFVLNRCIQYKCNWGQLYEELSQPIIESIVGSLLHAICSLHVLSSAGRARLELDISVLRTIFGFYPESTWRCIDDRLQFLCMTESREIRSQVIKAREAFLSEIRLQVFALNPDFGYELNPKGKDPDAPLPSSTSYALYSSTVPLQGEEQEQEQSESTQTRKIQQNISAPLMLNASTFAKSIQAAADRRSMSARTSNASSPRAQYTSALPNKAEPAKPSTFHRISAPEPPSKKIDDKDEHSERTEKSERSERTEKSERSEKTEKSERSEISEKSEKTEKSERSEKSDRSEKEEGGKKKKDKKKRKSKKIEKDEEEEKEEPKVEVKERSSAIKQENASSDSEAEEKEAKKEEEKSEKSEKEEKSEKSEKSEKEEKSEKSEKSEKEEKSEKSEKSDEEKEKEEVKPKEEEKSESSDKEEVKPKEEEKPKEEDKEEEKKKDKKKKKKPKKDEGAEEKDENGDKEGEEKKKKERKSSKLKRKSTQLDNSEAAEEKKEASEADEGEKEDKKKKKSSKSKRKSSTAESEGGAAEENPAEEVKEKKSKRKSSAAESEGGESPSSEKKLKRKSSTVEVAEGEGDATDKKSKRKSKKIEKAGDDEENKEEGTPEKKPKKKKPKKKDDADDDDNKNDANEAAAENKDQDEEKKKAKKKKKTKEPGDDKADADEKEGEKKKKKKKTTNADDDEKKEKKKKKKKTQEEKNEDDD